MSTPVAPTALRHHDLEPLDGGGLMRNVYWPRRATRDARPTVIVCHEMPGITPEFLGFIEHLEAAGFATVVPHLFGDVGRPMRVGYFLKSAVKVCVAKEFHVLAKGASSPVAGFLRALVAEACRRHGAARIGVIGMCFTGNFALGLLTEPTVVRAVASQPSLPFSFTPGSTRALHLSPSEIDTIRGRMERGEAEAVALRFSNDILCPRARFDALRETFQHGLTLEEIDSRRGNPHGISVRAHSVLTVDLVDAAGHPTFEARRAVVDFLRGGVGDAQTAP